jgi:DNA-3-methyladenine glycosylase II
MRIQLPYDFQRTLQVLQQYSNQPRLASQPQPPPDYIQFGLRLHDVPIVVTVRPLEGQPEELEISASPVTPLADLEALARWVLFDELDLAPFYRMVEPDPAMAPIVQTLWGVKPMRPPSLFEMAITVITEQQISLAAANRIRSRLVERFGDLVDGVWVFPDALTLAQASLPEIVQCGYSTRKGEYIRDFAAMIAAGSLDLEGMKALPEDAISQRLLAIRGWGPWSVNYFLVRGLARPDSVPVDDLAIRSVVGKYLGDGRRADAVIVAALLEPFHPYRGIVCFYLLAYSRLSK